MQPSGLRILGDDGVKTGFVDRDFPVQQPGDFPFVVIDAGDVDAEIGETRSGDGSRHRPAWGADEDGVEKGVGGRQRCQSSEDTDMSDPGHGDRGFLLKKLVLIFCGSALVYYDEVCLL